MRIPRFALLVAGIALAGAGGLAVLLLHPAGWLACVAGAVLGAVEFAPLERSREQQGAELGRDLAAEKKQIATDGIDDDWLKKQHFGGPGNG